MEGIKTQLLDLSTDEAELTTLVTLNHSHGDRCAKMLAMVWEYLGCEE